LKLHARSAVTFLVTSLLTALLACGKTTAGERCAHDSDCESGTCSLIGRCSPGECECSGEACGKAQSTCGDGQVCVAGQPPFELGYNSCRATCSVERPCADAKVCADGVCGSASVAALSWGNIPRTTACKPAAACAYDLRVRSGAYASREACGRAHPSR
jgi:hypothetical protein